MSAYVCEDMHISALAFYAVRHNLAGDKDEHAVFEVLHAENVASVNARYSGRAEEAPGRHNPACAIRCKFESVAMLKAAKCYRYQACEHDGWSGSLAERLTKAIIEEAISELPGYSDAAWGAPC